jgi:hypothetical protein
VKAHVRTSVAFHSCGARARVELLAVGLLAALIAVAAVIVLSFEEEKYHVTGGGPDLRLVAVRPDCGEELFDVEGRALPGRPFDGVKTNPWGSNRMRRDFLIELPAGTDLQPMSYQLWTRGHYVQNEFLATNQTFTGPIYALEAAFSDFYWHSGFFFGGQRPLEFVDLTFWYLQTERGPAEMRFPGPFAAGVTNKAQSSTQSWWNCELVILHTARTNVGLDTRFQFSTTMGNHGPGVLSFLDHQGRRHLPVITQHQPAGGRWMWLGLLPGLGTNQIAAAEVHQPQWKTFHHIKVSYPGRPARTGPVLWDK